MALTDHIKDLKSPICRFLREEFPTVPAAYNAHRSAVKKSVTRYPSERIRFSTVGMALDYRLRYYFAVTQPDELVAFMGARLYRTGSGYPSELRRSFVVDYGHAIGERPDYPPEIVKLWRRQEPKFPMPIGGIGLPVPFFAGLKRFAGGLKPVGRRLERSDEELLAKYCFTLALYEEVFRCGYLHPGSSLNSVRRDLDSHLGIATDAEVADLCELSWRFHDSFRSLIDEPAILNPKFDGSCDVDGADGDLIVRNCLIDFKTQKRPERDANLLRQLLEYVLLDYSDTYQLREVAILFTRQSLLLSWKIDELISVARGGEPAGLDEIRLRFREVIAAYRRWLDELRTSVPENPDARPDVGVGSRPVDGRTTSEPCA